MASAQGIRAGQAFVELFADDTKLVRGLKATEQKLKAFGAGVQSFGRKIFGLGAAVVASLAATMKIFSEMGDNLAKMSTRTGTSVEALSELGYAADQSGTDMENLEINLRKMQRTIVEAANGTEAAQKALGRLGLSAAHLGSLAPDEQLALIADRLDQIQNPALKAATAMEIFGKTGTSLLPLMQGGAKGIAELRQQARNLGLTISTEDAKAAEFFTDRLSDLWKVIKSGVFAIGSALTPLLQDLVMRATRIAKALADWIRQNKSLIVTVFKVAAVVAGAGAALIALGAVISGLGATFGVAASLIMGVADRAGCRGGRVARRISLICVGRRGPGARVAEGPLQ
jgi:TP901 family phage tail tape measure protein